MSKFKVRDIMTKKYFRVMSNDTFENARRLAIINRVKFLVVMKGDKVVGLITEDDLLKDASPSEKIEKVISSNIPKLLESATINEAAKLLLDNQLSCIPVFNELDDIVGVVRETDLVKDLALDKKNVPELSPERLAIYLSMTNDREKENYWLEEGEQSGFRAAITQVGETGEKLPVKFRESVIVAAIARAVISEELAEKIAVSNAARDVYSQLNLINPGLGGGFKVAIVRTERLIVVSAFGRCGHALANGPKTIAIGFSVI